MPTLMTQSTFDILSDVAHQLASATIADGPGLSEIFVPWAGEKLVLESRGIYYVGIAVNPQGEAYSAHSFNRRLQSTERFCQELPFGTRPFWQFLDRLTREILGSSYNQAQQRWGWSNLLKIVGRRGELPSELVDGQRAACVAAFREEIAPLRNSLVVIASGNEYGILYKSVADETLWNKEKNDAYFWDDPATGNLFVHCYHPQHMCTRPGMLEAAVFDIVKQAREKLPAF